MGNEGKIVSGFIANYGPTKDFSMHDDLPPEIRQWYYNAKFIWGASDAVEFLNQGLNINQTIKWMENFEQRAANSECLEVWGPNYPTELLKENPNAHQQTNPLPRLRRRAPQLHVKVERRRRRRGPTDRWGKRGT